MQTGIASKKSKSLFVFIVMAFAVLLLVNSVQATYKKPPFNGSIFGKRNNGIAGKTKLLAFIY